MAPALSSVPSIPSVSQATAQMPGAESSPGRERQQIFGVAPATAETGARQGHRGLPAGEQRDRLARGFRDFDGEPGMRRAEFGGFSGEVVAQHGGREPLPLGGPGGGGKRVAGPRDDLEPCVGERLRRFPGGTRREPAAIDGPASIP